MFVYCVLCVVYNVYIHVCVSRYQLMSYPAGSKSISSSGAKPTDVPSVRIKLQYKTVSIMPLKVYEDFLQVYIIH